MLIKKLFLSLLVIASTLIPFALEAQYFGRYPVQYEDFDFQVLETDHFDIYHYPQEAKAVKDLGRLSERWYIRYSAMLNHSYSSSNPLIIYANHADFQQNKIVPRVGVSTGGVTEGRRNRLVMPFAEANQSTNHVLGHELVHAFQYDIARKDEIGGIGATSQMPLWFIEGMAEYLSVGPEDSHTAMWLRDAIQNDDLPTIQDLSNSREYFPYRYGHSVWTFVAGQWGDEIVSKLYVNSAKNGIRTGISQTLGISRDSLSTLWQQAIREKYEDDIQARTNPTNVGKLVLGEEKNTGTINVSPSLSPDGEYIAFISEKNIFSIELFLANAETGKIIRKLTSTSLDPHLSALRFVESSGSWSPDGEKFAAVVFAEGDNQIVIINVDNGKINRRLKFGDVDAITNPSWSPNGEKIAFSGSDGGYTDLYLYDLENDSLQNLTDDGYSDLQPTWSPDGEKIAFVTDRGPDTNFDELIFGETKIAEMEVETGEIRLIPTFENAKHISPQYSADGNSIYYVSDFQGFSDVYRYDIIQGVRYQVTNVSTGISGISKLSPVITVAANTGDLMATVFNESNYSVYSISEKKKEGEIVDERPGVETSVMLPGSGMDDNQMVLSYLRDPITDIPSDTAFGLRDYKPTLMLDYITGAGGVGISSQFGAGVAGGISASFSDMLNQHQLFTSLRLQGRIQDAAAQAAYLNRDNRFVWGGSASHQVFRNSRRGISRNDTTNINGQQVVAPISVINLTQRVFSERISGLGLYPLTNTQRFEFSAGYTHLWYRTERRQVYLNELGQPFKRDISDADIAEPSPLNLFNASAAYVEDNSIAAFTGPINGHRMRFEVEPTTGSLTYVKALADYRKYFYMEPLTLGVRALHSGRYFQDSEDNRLSPNYIGNPRLIRGYSLNSYSAQECGDSPGDGCPEFERLFGSRLGIANIELRLPVLGIEDLALFRSQIFPSTLSAFFDAGVAWSDTRAPDFKWTTDETSDNIPVFSSGLSLRVNFLGFLITEFYYAVPFQRPDKTGVFGFQISPGW
ncbi:basic secretory protein-like protein [Gracilimonas sp. Q87]|uniref:basic secretory protein-like protein n=1 Tax=Gracilimonas sp. Q87 TaxID=3384766 RepID=UPI00398423CB